MPIKSRRRLTKALEEEVVIATPDKKKIYSTIGYPKGTPKGMVVFVHGLASTELWPTMLLGSWYFRKNGYAYCRINLYDWRKGARTLMTSDLLQHSRDTDTAVKYLKKKGFSNLYAVGHSFGGLTLLQAKTSAFSAISLWDITSFISYPPKNWFRKERGVTYMSGSFELMMSKRYQKGIIKFPDELKLISKIKVPCQICYASGKKGVLIESSKRYFQNVKSDKELVPVANAGHSFTEEGVSEVLFERTEKWFRRHRTY